MSDNMVSSFSTRLLVTEDFQQICEVYRSQTKHMSVASEDYFEAHCDSVLQDEYLSPSFDKKVMFGTFRDGRLVMCMGIFFWSNMPNCTFLRFASRQDAFEGRGIQYAFRSLYGACLDELEKRDYNRFYLLSSARHHEMLAHIGGTWDRFRQKYMMTIEEVIPENSAPRFLYIWQMMGERLWPVPLIVRSGTLLNKYRNFDLNIVSPRALEIWEKTGIE